MIGIIGRTTTAIGDLEVTLKLDEFHHILGHPGNTDLSLGHELQAVAGVPEDVFIADLVHILIHGVAIFIRLAHVIQICLGPIKLDSS